MTSCLYSDVYETIRCYSMLDPDQTTGILTGVSGGADSVCLLAVLHQLCSDGRINARLRAVHVNHGLRPGAADEDEAYVRKLCDDWNIPLEIRHIDVLSYSRMQRIGVEEAGHILRGRIFAGICEEWGQFCGCVCTALAHHQEDQAETQLFHLARGCDIRGLVGIPPVSDNQGLDPFFPDLPAPRRIIRPLIRNTREEIEQYLKENHIAWRTDESNSDLTYKRNLIRHKILPEMEKVNQAFLVHCGELSETAADTERYLARQTKQAWKRCINVDGIPMPGGLLQNREGKEVAGLIIHLPDFGKEDPLIQRRLCYQALVCCAQRRKDITGDHVDELLFLAHKKGNGRCDLCYDTSALRQYQWLWVGPSHQEEEAALSMRRKNEKSGLLFYPLKAADYAFRTFQYNHYRSEILRDTCTKWFDYDKIQLPVVFRTRQEGDILTISADGKHKSLSRYMIDEKIPDIYRNRLIMPFSGNEVLWVPGGRISARYLIDETTKNVLEIKLRSVE